ncbi:MAG: DUF3052 domain-containing protein [Actinomycetota bacterium]|nr:DUF3052 domain-containing protein [Actinomycetota bacterium]
MPGYSGTPLVAKLGIRPGDRIAILAGPAGFELELPDGATTTSRLPSHADVVLFFTTERARLERWIDRLGRATFPASIIWIAWPKKAAKLRPDMTEDVVREVALPLGLVDTKVCAIDDVWSGLKLVWRKDRRT